MKRLTTALKVFVLVIFRRDFSLNFKYGKKEFSLEKGQFAETTKFLMDLQKRNNFPDYILSQYKEVLTDYNYDK